MTQSQDEEETDSFKKIEIKPTEDLRVMKMEWKGASMMRCTEFSTSSNLLGCIPKSELEHHLTSSDTFQQIYGRFLSADGGMPSFEPCSYKWWKAGMDFLALFFLLIFILMIIYTCQKWNIYIFDNWIGSWEYFEDLKNPW